MCSATPAAKATSWRFRAKVARCAHRASVAACQLWSEPANAGSGIDVTTHLVDDVLPSARYRQSTLTFPWAIRVMLVQHPSLVTALQKIMVRRIERFLRRHVRDHRAASARTLVPSSPFNASVRASVPPLRASARSLHVWHIHCHAVIPYAGWALRDVALITVDLPPPTNDDVDTIVRDICRRVAAYIERSTADGTLAAPNTDDDCDDARDLAQLVLTDTIARKASILVDFPDRATPTRQGSSAAAR